MNRTQKNFKKQMHQAEKIEHKRAKKNKGAFSNRLFELRFYGYNGSYKKPQNKFTRLLIKLLRIVKWIILYTIFAVLVLIIIVVVISLKQS